MLYISVWNVRSISHYELAKGERRMTDEKVVQERHEEFMKKMNELNDRTYKSVKRLVKTIEKDVDFNEGVILNSITKATHEIEYTEKYVKVAPEFKQALLKEKYELESIVKILNSRKYEIGKEIGMIVRDQMIGSNILGTVNWRIREGWSDKGKIYLEASLHENEEIYKFLKNPDGYDYHWSYLIYTFPDGRKIEMRCDDSELTLDLNDEDITPQDYKHAFEELGLNISFDILTRHVEERRASANRLENIINLFSGE